MSRLRLISEKMEKDDESKAGSQAAAGHVKYRVRETGDDSTPRAESRAQRSNFEYSYGPIRSETASQASSMRKSGSQVSMSDLLPPEMESTPQPMPRDTPFKSWLTAGLLDILGTAVGVTGRIVAPPLHVTKSVILPGLLALFVDTLDAITPPRVQDWFRILSSSFHHLITVLGNTERGKAFTNQLGVVLQDILQAFSAPESRQVLVDGMATSVKFANALHTPEMKEFLEQLSTLGVRMLDAASSGKSKQLMQDTHDMAWKAIEMATDPATTLALAEVTAHLCHALEDAQKSLNPSPRRQRNKQNESIYLNPYQMSEFPEQVTMEEVILSCLGRAEDSKQDVAGDDAASLHSRLTLDDDFSSSEPDYQDWRERKEQVNVELLRQKIIGEGLPKSGRIELSKKQVSNERAGSPQVPKAESNQESISDENAGQTLESDDDVKQMFEEHSGKTFSQEDVEDIAFSSVVGGRKFGLKDGEKGGPPSCDFPAVEQFYKRLDELLKEDRERLKRRRALRDIKGKNAEDALGSHLQAWKARITNLKDEQTTTRSSPMGSQSVLFARLSRYKLLIIIFLTIALFTLTIFSGFACYGMYVLVRSYGGNTPKILGRNLHTEPASPYREVIVRVIREIVHVNENGEVIGKSDPSILTPDQLHVLSEQIETKVWGDLDEQQS